MIANNKSLSDLSYSNNFNSLKSFLKIENSAKEFLEKTARSSNNIQCLAPVTVVKVNSTQEFQELSKKFAVIFDGTGIISAMDRITNFDPDSKSIRRSNQEHPLHTDGTFEDCLVNCFALHFEEIDSSGGGESIFAPIDFILKGIPDYHLETLLENPILFAHKDSTSLVDKVFKNFAIRKHPTNDGEFILNFAWDNQVNMLPYNSAKNYQKVWNAIKFLRKQVLICPKLIYPAQKNDVIIIRNDQTLHGRLSIHSSSHRVVNRYYFGTKYFFTGLEEFNLEDLAL